MNAPSRQVALGALVVVVSVLLQLVVFSRLPLPGGRPSLPLVLVVAIALSRGPLAGAWSGFAAGLLLDALSGHPLGVLALIFMLVGLVVGAIEAESERSVFWSALVVAVAAVCSYLPYLLLLVLVHRGGLGGFLTGEQLGKLPTIVAYDVLLTPFVVPLVAAVGARRRQVLR